MTSTVNEVKINTGLEDSLFKKELRNCYEPWKIYLKLGGVIDENYKKFLQQVFFLWICVCLGSYLFRKFLHN